MSVYFTVSKDEQQRGGEGEAPIGILWFAQREEGQDDSRQTRSRRMARQAFWYLLNFFMTYVGTTAMRIISALNGSVPFGLICFTMVFTPWQGFWNAIIYMRPRYLRNREKYTEMSIWEALFTSDDQDHRLGARVMRSTVVPQTSREVFFGSCPQESRPEQGSAAFKDDEAVENMSAFVEKDDKAV